ncbi:MAG: hypothetical protein MHM6MM_004396 [Cercozoa sp. M6MM]
MLTGFSRIAICGRNHVRASACVPGANEALTVRADQDGMRAVSFLSKALPLLPFWKVRSLFDNRHVRVVDRDDDSARRIRRDQVLRPGQRLVVMNSVVEEGLPVQDETDEDSVKLWQQRILHEDDFMLALQKPKDTPCHSLHSVLPDLHAFQPVKELDSEMSGVLVVSRNPRIHARLQEALDYTYEAVCAAMRPIVVDDMPFEVVDDTKWYVMQQNVYRETDSKGNDRMRLATRLDVELGRPVVRAKTLFRVLRQVRLPGKGPVLLHLQLKTPTEARHQARVHCAQILNAPVLGDSRYGVRISRTFKKWFANYATRATEAEEGKVRIEPRAYLHAGSVGVEHPGLERSFTMSSETPACFATTLEDAQALRAARRSGSRSSSDNKKNRDTKNQRQDNGNSDAKLYDNRRRTLRTVERKDNAHTDSVPKPDVSKDAAFLQYFG